VNILSFIASIALAITLMQGFYILFRDFRSESNRLFFFICMCISIWLFGNPAGPDGQLFTIADNDWSLSSSSPLTVRYGGGDYSLYFGNDIAGSTRTTGNAALNANAEGWSIGAYEYMP